MSKIKTLIGINIPMIETNEEGKLRGGFTALNISPRTAKDNGVCSNISTSCSSNNVCSNLGTCHDNVICKSNIGVCALNGECGNSSLPEPPTTTTTMKPTSVASGSFGSMMF